MAKIPALTPYVRRAWYDTMLPETSIYDRIIYDYELIYIKEGKAEIGIGDRKYICTQGDLLIVRPMQRNHVIVLDNKPLIQPHVHFDLEYYENRENVPIPIDYPVFDAKSENCFRRDILEDFIEDFPSYIRPKFPKTIESLLLELIHCFQNAQDTHFRELQLQLHFLQLWQQVLLEVELIRNAGKHSEDYLQQIKTYLDLNIDRRVSLSELTELVNLSKSYLLRRYKETYGVTPLEYHVELRMKKAESMLNFTNLSVMDISNKLGFETVQDFSRAFKRFYGESPRQKRKTMAEQDN